MPADNSTPEFPGASEDQAASADCLQRVVSRLHEECLRLQKLRSEASNQVIEAELVYEDLTYQCKKAWEKYHDARKREPANSGVSRNNSA